VAVAREPITACSQADIERLLDGWHTADWQSWFRVGWAFSNCVVADPDAFFCAMLNDRPSFDTWLLGMNGHTFMFSDPKDKARLEELKQKMTAAATKASTDQEFGELPKILLDRLSRVIISEAPKIVD